MFAINSWDIDSKVQGPVCYNEHCGWDQMVDVFSCDVILLENMPQRSFSCQRQQKSCSMHCTHISIAPFLASSCARHLDILAASLMQCPAII